MKTLKLSILLFVVLIGSTKLIAQEVTTIKNNVITSTDIENLIGNWKGTLTYIDYSSKKPYSMPSELAIKSKRNNRKLILQYKYPDEPKANSKSKIKISKDRSLIDGKRIISRTKISDGNIQIITEYSGRDGNENQTALIRNIFVMGPNTFIIRKEVQFIGSEEWIKRNEYLFKKN